MKTFKFILLIVIICGCKKNETEINHDNHLIAYISTADHNYGEIYTCAMNGSGATRISELGAKNLSDAEYQPEFSPDGSKIKYRGFDFMVKVYDVNSKTTTSLEKAFDSEWISNGNRIAYVKTTDLERQIYVANADGGNAVKITNYEYYNNDTGMVFNGLAWHEAENLIIACAGVNHTAMSGFYLVKIHPASGKVFTMYPLYFNEYFTLRGNKITWANGDTVFIHDLISKNTTNFIEAGKSPKNPVLSPDGSRVAYTVERTYQYVENGITKNRTVTDMVTRSTNGFDRRELTVSNAIPDNTKYKSSFYPFWLSNTELLYAAGKIFKITDDVSPSVSSLTDHLQAGGQLQSNK